jgi:hypothetical protein
MIKKCKTLKMHAMLLFVGLALVACSNNSNMGTTNQSPSSISNFLLSGDGLIISLLMDEGENETDYFEGYVFLFDTNGTVSASNGSMTVDGTYSVFQDDGRTELAMNFPTVGEFDELDDDWYFISINQNTIRFDDDGDVLEFQQR